MAENGSPSTPPQAPLTATARSPMTPEQIRAMETSRLRAKGLRQQQEQAATSTRTSNGYTAVTTSAGQKRPHSAISSAPSTVRDARASVPPNSKNPNSNNGLSQAQDSGIRAARKFQKFVEYDFSKMTDTKGGFMTQEDDPYNKTLHAPDEKDEKPANMTLKEWERAQLQKRLRDLRTGPYEPGLSVLRSEKETKKCVECGSLEIDWQWDELLHYQVCHSCKEKLPEKYSLLTKTEAKEDYLLTDPELKDENLLPHLEKPNPHKSTWNNMMLYLRCQVETYAFSNQKWGSAEALDQEFERRKTETRQRQAKKFDKGMRELKKRTRVDAYKRARAGGGGDFGDVIGRGRHEHEWGGSVEDPETGMMKRRCVECGMEVEEMEF